MPPPPIDMKDKRIGRWLVLSRESGIGTSGRHTRWLCQCDCGTKRFVSGSVLRSNSLSCGCLQAEMITKRNTKHGKFGTRVYEIWHGMIQRCHNPNSHAWKWYGGRGIKVCDEWRNSFDVFYAAVGEPPDGLTLDRRDNNGNYELGNWRWATWCEQNQNRRPRSEWSFQTKDAA